MKRISQTLNPIERDLEHFLELYRHRSISKAADSLGVNQGNLSRVLGRLEKKLGEKLFHRHQKGLAPSEKANELANALLQMKELWDLQTATTKPKDPKISGTVKIGFHPSIGQTYLPRLLDVLQGLVHGSFEFHFGNSSEVTQKVMSRQIDLAIAINSMKSLDLIVKKIGAERIDLVGASNHKVQRHHTLLINPDMLFQGKIVRHFSPMRVIQIPSYEIIAEICRHNPGYWGVIPSGVRARFPDLQIVESIRDGFDVHLLSFPGSKIAPQLSVLAKSLRS